MKFKFILHLSPEDQMVLFFDKDLSAAAAAALKASAHPSQQKVVFSFHMGFLS